MPSNKCIDEIKAKLHTHFDSSLFDTDFTYLSTSDIWHIWKPAVCTALYPGLDCLAKDVGVDLPPSKAFVPHGTPIFKEVPLFAPTVVEHTSSSETAVTAGYHLQTQYLKQTRRLQDIINHLKRLLITS
eukprot:1618686-Karenia_brevis.AAC.1